MMKWRKVQALNERSWASLSELSEGICSQKMKLLPVDSHFCQLPGSGNESIPIVLCPSALLLPTEPISLLSDFPLSPVPPLTGITLCPDPLLTHFPLGADILWLPTTLWVSALKCSSPFLHMWQSLNSCSYWLTEDKVLSLTAREPETGTALTKRPTYQLIHVSGCGTCFVYPLFFF